jgi:hypothetical protein
MNFRSLVLELWGLLFSIVLWFIAMDKFFDAISKGMDWQVAFTLLGLGFIAGISAVTLIYKSQIDTIKERVNQKDDHIKFLDVQIQDLKSGTSIENLLPDELIALRHIWNWQNSNPQLDYWRRHTSTESLANYMGVDLGYADDLIQELKTKNFVTAEAFKGASPMLNRPVNFSYPVIITTKGAKALEKQKN